MRSLQRKLQKQNANTKFTETEHKYQITENKGKMKYDITETEQISLKKKLNKEKIRT